MVQTLLDKSGITTANWGGTPLSTRKRAGEALVQTTVKGTATVEIQGRMDESHPWSVIDTAIQSDSTVSTRIAVFPEMRAVVTGVDTTATATGGVSSTPASGSVTISENPSDASTDPTLLVILGTTAGAAYETLQFSGVVADEDTVQVINDGTGQSLNFEFDTTAEPYTSDVVFSGGAVAGDTIRISDIGKNGQAYYFSTTAGDNKDGTRTEILVGNGTTDAATNFQAAIQEDWLDGRIQIAASVAGSTVTLTQAALADTGVSAPSATKINSSSSITSTSWSDGTTGYTLANSSYIPIGLGQGTGTTLARDATYRAFFNEINQGNFTAVTIVTNSTNEILVTMKTPGTHHNHDADATTALPLDIDTASGGLNITGSAGTDGTDPVKLEINDSGDTPVTGYTLIARTAGEEVEAIISRITDEVTSATDWSGGKLTASSNYDNATVSLLSSGTSLTGFGNSTIQVVKDPHNIFTTSGMSGGAAGVTVICRIDVLEQT